jgi:hypothetical protein
MSSSSQRRVITARSMDCEGRSRFLEGLVVKDSPNLELLVSGPLAIVNFRYRGLRRLSEKALNRLNESLVSEIQERGIAIPSHYAIGGKSCVRVCNLNQRSQRSDFEALVQACEQLGVELEALEGSQSRSAREDPQGCGTTMMMGTGQERGCANHRARASPKAFSRRITESCSSGTIIVIVMTLCNCRFCINISGTLGDR